MPISGKPEIGAPSGMTSWVRLSNARALRALLRHRLGAVDHLFGRGVDAREQRIDRLAADVLDLDTELVGIDEERGILQGELEGAPQRREPLARHAGRREEWPSHLLRRKEELEHLAVLRRLGVVDDGGDVGQLWVLLERHLVEDVDLLVAQPVALAQL